MDPATPPRAVIALQGHLDSQSAPSVREQLLAAVELGVPEVEVDCRQLAFVDSYGVSVLMSAHRRLAESGHRLALINAGPQLLQVLSFTRLDEVFAIR